LDKQPVETTLYSLDGKTPEPSGRRTGERHLSLLRVGSLMIADRRELCLIRNISAGGMMIRAYSSIDPGTRLSIELKQGEPVSATVKWAKDENVGLEFDEPIDVISLISISGEEPRPRMPRVEVNCTAWVREGAIVHRTKAVDVSQGGLKIHSSKNLAIGAEVIVTLTGLSAAPGTVRWKDGDSYGISFNGPLALPTLVGWLQQQQERERPRAVG
jgi:hypothetical protein